MLMFLSSLFQSVTLWTEDAECTRAMRRLIAPPQDPPKWVLEKCWDLNASRSKQIIVGFDMSRMMDIMILLGTPSGLGVKLSVLEVHHLLSTKLRDVVLEHVEHPKCAGNSHTKAGAAEYLCTVLRSGEPGLRVSKGEEYVVLGKVTCQMLYFMAPAILQRVAFLDVVGLDGAKWIVRYLEAARTEAATLGNAHLTREKDVLPVMTALTGALGAMKLSPTALDVEKEMFSDMVFRHKDLFARMYVDYVGGGARDDDSADDRA